MQYLGQQSAGQSNPWQSGQGQQAVGRQVQQAAGQGHRFQLPYIPPNLGVQQRHGMQMILSSGIEFFQDMTTWIILSGILVRTSGSNKFWVWKLQIKY